MGKSLAEAYGSFPGVVVGEELDPGNPPDVVEACSPGQSRVERAEAAFAGGTRFVSVLSPVAPDLEAVDHLAKVAMAAASAGAHFRALNPLLHEPALTRAKKLVDGGVVGEVVGVHAMNGVRVAQDAPTGVSLDEFVARSLSCLSWLLGERLESCFGNVAEGEGALSVHATFKFAKSRRCRVQRHYGTLELHAGPGYSALSHAPLLELNGTHGVLWVNPPGGDGLPVGPASPTPFPPLVAFREGRVDIFPVGSSPGWASEAAREALASLERRPEGDLGSRFLEWATYEARLAQAWRRVVEGGVEVELR